MLMATKEMASPKDTSGDNSAAAGAYLGGIGRLESTHSPRKQDIASQLSRFRQGVQKQGPQLRIQGYFPQQRLRSLVALPTSEGVAARVLCEQAFGHSGQLLCKQGCIQIYAFLQLRLHVSICVGGVPAACGSSTTPEQHATMLANICVNGPHAAHSSFTDPGHHAATRTSICVKGAPAEQVPTQPTAVS